MKEFTIIEAQLADDVISAVNKHLAAGWELHGPMTTVPYRSEVVRAGQTTLHRAKHVQAMVRIKKEATSGLADFKPTPELDAIAALVGIFVDGSHYETRNPYSRKEVHTGLQLLAAAAGVSADDVTEAFDVYRNKSAADCSSNTLLG